ncbi:MAG: hypothetical protein GY859_35295, partial [Desulfobacterales bacterium]|nr:hypothetical protein [Desulfobacterales bacterium]
AGEEKGEKSPGEGGPSAPGESAGEKDAGEPSGNVKSDGAPGASRGEGAGASDDPRGEWCDQPEEERDELTVEEKRLAAFLRLSALAYLVVGVLIAAAPRGCWIC